MNRAPFRTVGLLILAIAVSPVAAAGGGNKAGGQVAGQPRVQPPMDQQSITSGTVTINGDSIEYKAIAGIMVLENHEKQNKPYATMSYVAYIKSDVDNRDNRPITFFYNGGPGSATMWLHMLAFGPQRIVVGNGVRTPLAPYRMVNNSNSLLDATDMVFVDAPGTGFGRVIGKKQGGVGKPEDVFGIDEDSEAFTQFIKTWLTERSRWNSPRFLFGESYGTTRSAVLAYDLERANVYPNGIVLLSAILNFNLAVDAPKHNPGINLSYATALPTYAATAWYHDQLPNQPKKLVPFLDRVEHFAMTDYLLALNEGNRIDPARKREIAKKMHRYTGLPVAYILEADLTVNGGQFSHELLREQGTIIGRLDSRYQGPTKAPLAESSWYDPMMPAIAGPTVARFNQYIRKVLKFGEGLIYRVSADDIKDFDWNVEHKQPGLGKGLGAPNVMPDLAAAMILNPDMNIMLAGGYFDLGTPYYAAEYELYQLNIPPRLQNNITYHFLKSGHMIYLDPQARDVLRDATAKFIEASYEKR